MKLYFLSVGYGESMVILHNGHCMVIDGGADGCDEAYTHKGTITLNEFLTAHNIKEIDLMICTHIHNDHVSGLAEVAEKFKIKEFRSNIYPTDNVSTAIKSALPKCPDDLSLRLFTTGLTHFDRLRKALNAQNTKIREQAQTDGYETLWNGCEIRFFGMDKDKIEKRRQEFSAFCNMKDEDMQINAMRAFDKVENTCSLACHIKSGDISAMLTGDLCSGWDERCAKNDYETAQILKVTHHGQKDGMPDSMLCKTDPEIIVMCSDDVCTFSSACPDVINRAKNYLVKKSRQVYIYNTGRLVEQFGDKDGEYPSALCCKMEGKSECTPYYK